MRPKFSFLLAVLILLIMRPAAEGQSWAIGIQVGENLSTLTGDQESDYRLGFVAGVNASHYLTQNLVLRLELNVERKGSKYENPVPEIPEPDAATDYQLDYLSLPVMLRYSTGKKVKFTAGGGVSVDYLLRERTQFVQSSIDESGQFRKVDVDLVAGVGAGVPIGEKFVLSFELRTLYGMVKVGKPNGIAKELGRNFSWGLMAGLNYYL